MNREGFPNQWGSDPSCLLGQGASRHGATLFTRPASAAGARRFFLPPYSPDLNPIEQVFAKLKHLLLKARARAVEARWRNIDSLIDRFAPDECAIYVHNAGYASI